MRLRTIIAPLLLLAILLPIAQAGPPAQPGPTPNITTNFSVPQRFTSTQTTDFSPSPVQALDGTVWVFYAVTPMNSNGQPSNPQIRYRTATVLSATYNASLWSSEQTLVSTPLGQNVSPFATQSSNGTIFLAFSSNRTGPFNIYLKKYNSGTGWANEVPVTWGSLNDKEPSVVAAKDGTVWVFWYRVQSSTQYNIYYKTNRNGVWSIETQLTTDSSAQNTDPYGYQTHDGNFWMVWSHYDSTIGQVLFYKTYNTTTNTWSIPIQITSTSNADAHPALTQDQNNTIWLAWSRNLSCGGLCFQFDVFFKYSLNYGSTWSADANLTNDASCTSNCPDDIMSSDAQLKDGRIYVFWTSTRDPQNYWNLYYSATAVMPFHNVGVTALNSAPTLLRSGGIVSINVTVMDTGTFPESFFLFVTATNTSISTVAVQYLSLGAGQAMKISIAWNSSLVRPGEYTISANIPPINSEIVTGDNLLTGGWVHIVPQGDVNYDGTVNINDLALIAISYNTSIGQPGYNPNADLNHDGAINIVDLAICAYNFGAVG